jgi:cytidylate kinase
MGVVAISRQYGSGGRRVGVGVAKALDYMYIDKELIAEVSREAGVPIADVEAFDERPEHSAVRVLRKLLSPSYPGAADGLGGEGWGTAVAVPELYRRGDWGATVLDEDVFLRLTQEVMLRLVSQENVVLIGRGTQALLANRSDVLHVRVIAPEEHRIKTIQERDGRSRSEAAKRMKKVDGRRMRYIKRHYGVNWDNPELYHLVVNTALTGIESAVCMTAEAARSLPMERPRAAEA